jgi:hypothetical protein
MALPLCEPQTHTGDFLGVHWKFQVLMDNEKDKGMICV